MAKSADVRFAVALTILLLLLTGAHIYIWRRLIRRPAWPRRPQQVLTIALTVLGLSLPIGIVAARVLPRGQAGLFAGTAFVWLGVLFFLALSSLAAELIRGLVALRRLAAPSSAPDDPSRRLVFERGLTLAVGASSGLGSALALAGGMREAKLAEVEVSLERLPPVLDGLSVVQISDVHIGPTLGVDFMREVMETVRAAKPDLFIVTGDLVDGSVAQLQAHVAPLAAIAPRFGAYFITGNHEFYSGADAWCDHLSGLGLRVLRNQWIRPVPGLQVVGVDDYAFQRGAGARIAPNLEPDEETLLLAHRPQSIIDAEALRAGLQISGHTHGGQLYPATELVRLTTPYVAGLYRHDERTQVYVSRGTGFWGPPMRLGAPSEVTRLILRSKRPA